MWAISLLPVEDLQSIADDDQGLGIVHPEL